MKQETSAFECSRCKRPIKGDEPYIIEMHGHIRHKYIQTCNGIPLTAVQK